MGHDSGIELPNVPGHELASIDTEVGRNVSQVKIGDRVKVPFVGGCGDCSEFHAGQQQVCFDQIHPGFTHWG